MIWIKTQKPKPLTVELELAQSQFRVIVWSLTMTLILLVGIASLLGRAGLRDQARPTIMILAAVSSSALLAFLFYQRSKEKCLEAGQPPDHDRRRQILTSLAGGLVGAGLGVLVISLAFMWGGDARLAAL